MSGLHAPSCQVLFPHPGDAHYDIRNRIPDTTVRIRESDIITLCKKHGICEDQDGLLFTRSGKLYVPKD